MRNKKRGLTSTALVVLMAVALAMIAAISIAGYLAFRHPHSAPPPLCVQNLNKISGAKTQWASDKGTSATVTLETLLADKWLITPPLCPDGGAYTMNPIGAPPACSKSKNGSDPAHSLR